MNERIKQLRKSLGLNQTDFGDRIGVKQATIASYESGARTPIEAVTQAICREFRVSELWLREGKGEMFEERPRGEEIAEFAKSVINSGSDSFKSRFIGALAKLTPDAWAVLEQIAKDMQAGNNKP